MDAIHPPAAVLVRIDVEPSAEDFVEVSMLPFRDRRRRNTLLLVVTAAMVVAGVVMAGGNDVWGWVFVAMLLYIALRSAGTSRGLLRAFYHKHPHLGAHCVITVREDGVLVEQGPVDTMHRWPAFTHVEETPTLFLLQRGAGYSAVYVPKRCVGDQAAVAALRTLLVARIGRTEEGRVGFPVAAV